MAKPVLQVLKRINTPHSMTSTNTIGWRMLSTNVLRAMVNIWRRTCLLGGRKRWGDWGNRPAEARPAGVTGGPSGAMTLPGGDEHTPPASVLQRTDGWPGSRRIRAPAEVARGNPRW